MVSTYTEETRYEPIRLSAKSGRPSEKIRLGRLGWKIWYKMPPKIIGDFAVAFLKCIIERFWKKIAGALNFFSSN
jgi:hypothetical protein